MINKIMKKLSELPNVTLSNGQEYIQLYDAMETVKRALEQEQNRDRDIEEIKEVINCDADAEIKLKMISNILTAKSHYFEKQERKIGYCKDCKYFEYDSVAKVDKIPLIVAHEICSKWGDGCKTKEDGYCFLFEPQV